MEPDAFSGALAGSDAGCLPRAEQQQRICRGRRGDVAEVWTLKRSTSLHFVFSEAGCMVANRIAGAGARESTRQQRRHTACEFAWIWLAAGALVALAAQECSGLQVSGHIASRSPVFTPHLALSPAGRWEEIVCHFLPPPLVITLSDMIKESVCHFHPPTKTLSVSRC